MESAVAERIAEQAMNLAAGDVAGVVEWLEALGCTDPWVADGQASVTGVTGIRVGLTRADPIAAAVSLAFALLGPQWPVAAPDLLSEVQRLWRDAG